METCDICGIKRNEITGECKCTNLSESELIDSLDCEELEIVKLCKAEYKRPYESVEKITKYMRNNAGCSLYSHVITSKLIEIIAKAI